MPTYPLTFPTNVAPEDVRVTRRYAQSVHTSPSTYTQQIYQRVGKRWEIEVTLQPMAAAEAASWTQFFYDLEGQVGTFAFNLTPHCPGLSPAPGAVNFRLAEPNIGWTSRLATEFGFTFRAVEDL